MRDFGFLEEVDFAIDRAGRNFRKLGESLRLYQRGSINRRQALLDACASPDRRTRLMFAPAALEQGRSNTSRVMGLGGNAGKGKGKGKSKGKGKDKGKGKGKDKGGKGSDGKEGVPPWIAWRIEWHFGKSNQVLTDKGLSENTVIDVALRRLLDNTWSGGATRHLILPYVEAGAENLEVFLEEPSTSRVAAAGAVENLGGTMSSASTPALASNQAAATSSFVKLDRTATLRAALIGRAVVEFPVLRVALPQECGRFLQPLARGQT